VEALRNYVPRSVIVRTAQVRRPSPTTHKKPRLTEEGECRACNGAHTAHVCGRGKRR